MIGSGGTKRVSSRYTATPAASYYPLCGLLSYPLVACCLCGWAMSHAPARRRHAPLPTFLPLCLPDLCRVGYRGPWLKFKCGRCASCWQIFAVLVRTGSHVCVTMLLTTSSHDLTLSRAARVVPCRMIQELPQQLEVPALALRWGDGADRGGVCWLMRMCIHVLIVVHWWLLAALLLLLLLQAPLTSHPRPVS